MLWVHDLADHPLLVSVTGNGGLEHGREWSGKFDPKKFDIAQADPAPPAGVGRARCPEMGCALPGGVGASDRRGVISDPVSCDIMISGGRFMAQLVVRGLEEDVKTKLQQRARRHGRSTEEEVREILRNAVREEAGPPPPLGTLLRNRFADLGLQEELPDARGGEARPANFTL